MMVGMSDDMETQVEAELVRKQRAMTEAAWKTYRHTMAFEFAQILLAKDDVFEKTTYPGKMCGFAYALADAMIEAGK